ncbi:hypothetical protein LDO26_02670 [Luteimonas sp. BDR2-5]|uniref:hypothetical protein n=1 Tax=Proluteimonas luteida TaxID=2878685 RepID=UPI001E29F98D|nr:hypothetical protein [Luteimonas sp. BDR2-5]MCD9027117.1 hypothetical protein [Luteimonas sp. BDR2-5]
MNIPTSVLPSALALALAAALPAAAHAQSTQAELQVDVATHAMPGMPGTGALGRMAGAMAGSHASYGMARHPGMPGQYLDIALHNQRQPGTPARQAIPQGLRLGDHLDLLPPAARDTRDGGSAGGSIGQDLADGGRYRVLYYWGCGESAGPGQPVEYSMTIRNGKPVEGGRAMAPRQLAGRSITPGPEFALWPNPSSRKAVRDGASLVGTHHVTGNGVPESMRFELERNHDFMPPLAVNAEGSAQDGLSLRWDAVTGARGYFIHGTVASGETIVMWSSAEDGYAGPELIDYLTGDEIARWTGSRTLMGADARSCQVPREVLAGTGGGTPLLQMIAYGDENSITQPRPADAPRDWRPAWNIRLRNKSTAMVMLGADGTPVDAGAQQPDTREAIKDRARGLMRGILGR